MPQGMTTRAVRAPLRTRRLAPAPRPRTAALPYPATLAQAPQCK